MGDTAIMPLTAAEQYLLKLINRARLDPLADDERYHTFKGVSSSMLTEMFGAQVGALRHRRALHRQQHQWRIFHGEGYVRR